MPNTEQAATMTDEERAEVHKQLEETLDMQDEIFEALLTLWERLKLYAGNTDPRVNQLHYRIFDAFCDLEKKLQEHSIITGDVVLDGEC